MNNQKKIVDWLNENGFADSSRGGVTMLDRNVWSHGNGGVKAISGLRVAFGVDEVSVTCFAGQAGRAPVSWEAKFTPSTPWFVVTGTARSAVSG